MIQLFDQIGNKVVLAEYPNRILSVVPSLTELLFDLGLQNNIVGRTKFCIHPKEIISTIPKIGGTKKLHIDKILQLKPELIIANKEENVKEQIDHLLRYVPVYVSDIQNIEQATVAIQQIGTLTNTIANAKVISSSIKHQWNTPKEETKINVCYLIWNEPMMTVGGDTFINDVLSHAGFENVFNTHKRYPEVTFEAIVEHKPDYIFLSSEPYPFRVHHLNMFNELLQNQPIKTRLVDGEMFSWYGSRLLKAAQYVKELKSTL